jgi:hypothetical protein
MGFLVLFMERPFRARDHRALCGTAVGGPGLSLVAKGQMPHPNHGGAGSDGGASACRGWDGELGNWKTGRLRSKVRSNTGYSCRNGHFLGNSALYQCLFSRLYVHTWN